MATFLERPGEQQTPHAAPVRAFTFRSVFIGLLGVAAAAFATPYSDLLVRGTWMACSHLPMLPLLTFAFLILVVNSGLRRLNPRWCLTQAELFVIYIMMLIGALLPSFGISAYLIPTISGSNYFVTPEGKWVETFYTFIRPWMVPFDPTSHSPTAQHSMRQFYEGIGSYEAIPWRIWVRPLAAWTVFGFGLFFVWTCMAAILRKQWVDNEKLAFPLVQLPVEMARQGDGFCWAGNPFFRNKLTWIGFAIPVVIHTVNGLHFYYPSIPEITINVPLNPYIVTFPWKHIGAFQIFTHFSVIGFTFLLSSDLSFSLWFFFLLFKLADVIAAGHGMVHKAVPNYPVNEFEAHQMLGAFIVFFGYMIYLSRRQIAEVVRKAFTRAADVDDSNESLSYRTAFFGLILGTLFLSGWCWLAGMSFWLALACFGMFYLIAISLTRFVAEGGILFIQAPFQPTELIGAVAGIGSIGAANLTALTFVQRIFVFDLRGFLMPSLLDSMKMTDAARINRRRLTLAIAASILVAVVVSYATIIWIGYRKGGGVNLSNWFFTGSPTSQFTTLTQQITTPQAKDWSRATLVMVGAAVTLFLSYMRFTFSWWPLHPMGYAMGPSWPMIQLWFSIMVGWTLKTAILRYGGMKGFAKARPLFLGLVLGEFMIAGFWLALDALTGIKDHRIFLN